ncbi:response regulator [Candidatus Saccharibacteria bacterium]|nr:response regulator [Candidatus Saccharibacteria bacterium]
MADKRKKILIVEDDTAIKNALINKFDSASYEVLAASDGEEGLRAFTSFKPDIVLLDIVMPKKNGFEVLEAIRLNDKSHVPILILSNLEMENDRQTGKDLGADGYYIKAETTMSELAKIIKSKLER